MNNEKYVYNPVTLRYEKVEVPLKSRVMKTIAYAIAVMVTGFLFYIGIDRLVISPQEKIQKRVIDDMSTHLAEQTKFIDKLSVEIDDLQEKDANVHRIIFGMDPIDEAIWNGGIGGDNPYRYLENSAAVTEQLESYLSKAKKLERKVTLQKKSLDTLHHLAAERETRLASIPSIKPVREDKLKKKLGALSGYGIRLHPVHKVKKHHAGIDFTAPRMVDHGYGFTTLYAHMYSIDVKKGDVVTKGQQLGAVGSTGTSTAPHLHYEVRVNGKAINPIDYVLDGLTPTEYQELVDKAGIANQSFD